MLVVISGCEQKPVVVSPYPKVAGAWKSKKIGALSRKPDTVIFLENGVFMNKKTVNGFEYIEKSGVILVNRAGEGTIFKITTTSNPNEVRIENFGWGTQDFVKTTKEDVEAIENAPPPPDRRNEPL